VAYCKKCDLVYCKACGFEWKNQVIYQYPPWYNPCPSITEPIITWGEGDASEDAVQYASDIPFSLT
jgi:hypothetical protein